MLLGMLWVLAHRLIDSPHPSVTQWLLQRTDARTYVTLVRVLLSVNRLGVGGWVKQIPRAYGLAARLGRPDRHTFGVHGEEFLEWWTLSNRY